MVRYLTLLKFTSQGAKMMEKSTDRANTFQREATAAGIHVESMYWCQGGLHDGILIMSAPDEHTALRQLALLKKTGNVTTECSRLFTAAEFDVLIGLRKDG